MKYLWLLFLGIAGCDRADEVYRQQVYNGISEASYESVKVDTLTGNTTVVRWDSSYQDAIMILTSDTYTRAIISNEPHLAALPATVFHFTGPYLVLEPDPYSTLQLRLVAPDSLYMKYFSVQYLGAERIEKQQFFEGRY